MRVRLLTPLLLVALLLAGCGGGSSAPTLKPGEIAAVDGQTVSLAEYTAALAVERANLKDQGTAFPAAGSTNYKQMETNIIDALFQQAIIATEAQKDGLHVTTAEVNAQLKELVKVNFGGSMAKYDAGIKKAGYTAQQILSSVREDLLKNKLEAFVVKGVKPTAAQVRASYQENLATYETPSSRAVEEILVGKNKQALAEQIVAKLKAGASFAALAKQYSQDPGSKDSGGKFTAQQGKDVPEFDAAVFAKSAKTGELLAPVNTSAYGWFVIEPLGPIKPATVESEAKAAPSIIKTLTQNDDSAVVNSWYAGIEKSVCNGGSVVFAAGYTPSPTPCSTLTATNQTTT